MITESEVILRILYAAILGGLIGWERGKQGQPAGLRTHIIFSVGATIAMCVSVNVSLIFPTKGDSERIAAQVVSGIGFLGAGTILKYGGNVRGLTTAASIWTTAIIALAIGAGHFRVGIFAAGLVLFALIVLDSLEKDIISQKLLRVITITAKDRPHFVDHVKHQLYELDIDVGHIEISKNTCNNNVKISLQVKLKDGHNLDYLIYKLQQIKGIASFSYNTVI
jgi:putative Mg2+ transporter-C (MgtC) family protein